MRNYTEGVYKRKRNGRIVFDGVLAYYDENGKRKFAHRERNKESLAPRSNPTAAQGPRETWPLSRQKQSRNLCSLS